jgi:hypothetical protein
MTACDTTVAFRGRSPSLLFTCAPAGSHLFRFSRRSLRLALQSTPRSYYMHETYAYHNIKKSERFIVRIYLHLKYCCPVFFYEYDLKCFGCLCCLFYTTFNNFLPTIWKLIMSLNNNRVHIRDSKELKYAADIFNGHFDLSCWTF